VKNRVIFIIKNFKSGLKFKENFYTYMGLKDVSMHDKIAPNNKDYNIRLKL
jgi:hypothetical protein